jgi:GDP-L-fucose synthase
MLDAYRNEYGFNGIYLLPVNLYGPGDNFDPQTSHVIPALIRKFAEAVETQQREVTCWGSGNVTREFLYVDDAAEAIVRATERHNDSQPINLGTGREISIRNLAGLIAHACGYDGRITWDASRPDGQPRRQLDCSRAEALLDWRASVTLEEGISRTVEWRRARVPAPHISMVVVA